MNSHTYVSKNCQHDHCETCLDRQCKCICHPVQGATEPEPFTMPAQAGSVKFAELLANALRR